MPARATESPVAATAVRVRDGLATLGPRAAALRSALDGVFTAWAAEVGADVVAYPPLLRIPDLDRLDYFRNFPHLALVATGIDPAVVEEQYVRAEGIRAVPPEHVEAAGYALPSAACYSAYLDMTGLALDGARRVTTVATCFRRETRFDGLRRLLAFTMREIVCVGPREVVLDHLAAFKSRIAAFLRSLALPVTVAAASDPFFEANASRAVMQQLFPVKEEFLHGGDLAIASVNYHRNFFGERCEISLPGGEAAYSGCVAFGLERWIAALTAEFGDDLALVHDRVLAAASGETAA